MKKAKLTNSFHRTEATILAKDGQSAYDAWMDLSIAAAQSRGGAANRRRRRVWSALCGIEDCKCGVVR